MIVRTGEELKILKEGGRRLADILHKVAKHTVVGAKSSDLNKLAEQMVLEGGDKSAFLNYKPEGATRPYPAALCVSINDEIVHGIPNEEEKVLKEGDLVVLDMGLIHEGLVTDSAITVLIGKVDEGAKKLTEVTKKALDLAIEQARVGNNVGEIGFAVEEYVMSEGFVPADDLGGHGVGERVHEAPFVPNIGPRNRGPKLIKGQIIAIEPIVNEGTSKIYMDKDGYTFKTADGKRSAQFEHTVMVTDGEPIILTEL
jgi:methionyl aminopeptidase